MNEQCRELLKAAKLLRNFLGGLNDCRYCGVIFVSMYGVQYKAKHKRNCQWIRFQRAIKRLEQSSPLVGKRRIA